MAFPVALFGGIARKLITKAAGFPARLAATKAALAAARAAPGAAGAVALGAAGSMVGTRIMRGAGGARGTYLERVQRAADLAGGYQGSPYVQRRVFGAAMGGRRGGGLSRREIRGFYKVVRLIKTASRKMPR